MRIALAQINPTVGDVSGNLHLILDAIEQARQDRAEILVTSELALIGYPPKDLLLRQGVVEACEQAVQHIARAAKGIWVVAGHPRRVSDGVRPLRNSVSVCHDGYVVAVSDKQLLPGYDVFDEDRYFEPGEQSLVVPVAGKRCGIVVCEDLWRAADVTSERRYTVQPITGIASQRPELLLSLNASPFVLGKWQKHLDQLAQTARQLGCPVIAVNQAGANDDLVFDGRSVVIDSSGSPLHVLAGFESETRTIEVNFEPAAAGTPGDVSKDVERWSDPSREIYHALRLGLSDYARKTSNDKYILGLSGGVDSALAAALATGAVGASHVTGVMMPSIYSSPGSLTDAIDLAKRLNIKPPLEIPISSLHEQACEVLREHADAKVEGVTDENIQSRLRGLLLMAVSNETGGLVLATSNKSEMAVGYSTLYGDMCGAIAPLGDLTKTRLYELARWMNRNHDECGFAQPPIPQPSIDKPPSAELRPNQTDQDSLPPYDVLDQIIELRLERELSVDEIIQRTGCDALLVRKTVQLIDRSQFKRDQAPVVLKITPRAFGPGRPMPIAMRERLEMESPDRPTAAPLHTRDSSASDRNGDDAPPSARSPRAPASPERSPSSHR